MNLLFYNVVKGANAQIKNKLLLTFTPLLSGKSPVAVGVYDRPTQRCLQTRHYAVRQRKNDQIVEATEKTAVSSAQKVKQVGKDATYTGIVLLGLGVTGIMFFAIGRELFSSQSPSGVYSAAFKRCKKSTEISDLLGTPMKGYGEMTRRGRRRHVSNTEYERDGMQFMRMKFYIEGPLAKGTVQLEMKKSESGKWEYRYLFVDVDSYPKRTVVLDDNR